MADLLLVLQMANYLGSVRQSPRQTTSVGRPDFLWRFHLLLAVPLPTVVIHRVDEVNNVVIDAVLALTWVILIK